MNSDELGLITIYENQPLTALQCGANGQALLYGLINVSLLVLESIQQDPFSFSLSF